MARPSERSFRYQKRSREDVRERANMRGGGFDSIFKPQYKLYKPRDGKNLIRILPPTWDKARHYGLDIFVNYNIGADNQSYLSLSKMKGEADPLAEARKQAERDGDKELSKALNPTQRILIWLIDRLDEDEGPQLWAAPFTFDKAVANICFDEDTKEVVFIDDPDTGCDLRFYREGSGLATKYDGSKMKLMKASPIFDDSGLQNDTLAFIQENPLPDVLNFYDYDHIASVFDGRVHQKDEDEEKPARGTRRAVEDEEETPQRSRRPSLSRDDDEDEEQEVRPRHRQAAPAEDDDEPPFEKDEEPELSVRDRIRGRRRPVPADED